MRDVALRSPPHSRREYAGGAGLPRPRRRERDWVEYQRKDARTRRRKGDPALAAWRLGASALNPVLQGTVPILPLSLPHSHRVSAGGGGSPCPRRRERDWVEFQRKDVRTRRRKGDPALATWRLGALALNPVLRAEIAPPRAGATLPRSSADLRQPGQSMIRMM